MELNPKNTCLKNDNRGFSLIEVLVVVAILAVMATLTVSASSYLARGNIKEATKTVYSAIASNQTYSKSKSGDWTFSCTHNGSQYILTSTCISDISGSMSLDVYDEKALSNRVTSVKIKDSTEADYSDLSTIKFQKNTGAVASINGSDVPKAGYADIEVAISGSRMYLRLYYLTGEIETLINTGL